MDVWKGEKLHGAGPRMMRARAESGRIPARSVAELYVQTRVRGPRWRAASPTLSRLTG